MGDMAVVWGSKFIASLSSLRPVALLQQPTHPAHGAPLTCRPARRAQVSDAGECCEACKAHARVCGQKDGNGKVFHEKAPHPCGHEYEKACNMCVRPRGLRALRRCIGAGGGGAGTCAQSSCQQGLPCGAVVRRWVFCEGSGPQYDNRCFSFDIHNHTRGECWLKRQARGSACSLGGGLWPTPACMFVEEREVGDALRPRPIRAIVTALSPSRPQADPTKPTVGDENSYPAKMRAAKREIWPWAVEEKLWPWEMPEKASGGQQSARCGFAGWRCAPVCMMHVGEAFSQSCLDAQVHWISGVLTDPPLATVRPEKPINFVRWCDKNGPCEELA